MVGGLSVLGRLRSIDPFISAGMFVLMLCGFALIHSASAESSIPFVASQFKWAVIALGVSVPLILIPYSRLLTYAWLAYSGGLVLLMLVPVAAPVVNGARRWFTVGPFSVQPSEIMKVLTVLFLARLLRFGRTLERPREWLPPLLVAGIPAGLTLVQPDLGTSLLFVPVALAVLFVSGIPKRTLVLLATLGVIAMLVGYAFVLKPYQKERIRNTFNQSRLTDTQVVGGGYQLDQSLTAIGNGGVIGHGHREGPRTQSGKLPYRHNDFIFAVLGEEHGFLGAAGVLLMMLVMSAWIFRVARRTRDPAGRILAVGIGTLLWTQATVHAAVNLGLVPTTGMPFPFLSHGGSSLLTCVVATALVLNVSIHRPAVPIRTRVPDDGSR